MDAGFYWPEGMAFKVLHLCSLVLSVVATTFIAFLVSFRRDMRRRSSLYLRAIIGLLDASRHLQVLISEDGMDSCPWLGFYSVFGTHAYALFIAAIAFQLHCVYVLERAMLRLWWIIPLVVIFITDLFLLGPFICNVSRDYIYLIYGIVLIPAVGYCLFVTLCVFTKPFVPPSHDFMMDTILNSNRLTTLTRNVQRTVRYTAMYPLVCAVCLVGQIIDVILHQPWSQAWHCVGFATTGSLHFILLVIDANIRHAILAALKALVYDHHDFPATELPSIMRHSRLNETHKPIFVSTPAVIVTHHQIDTTPLLQFQRVLDNCSRI